MAAIDAAACCELCRADLGCLAYTFNANDDPGTNTCWLKAVYDNTSATTDDACTSGSIRGRKPASGCHGTSSPLPCSCEYDGTPPSERWTARLYHLSVDPQERHECAGKFPEKVEELRSRLQPYIDGTRQPINMFSDQRVVDPASDPSLPTNDGAWGPWLPDLDGLGEETGWVVGRSV